MEAFRGGFVPKKIKVLLGFFVDLLYEPGYVVCMTHGPVFNMWAEIEKRPFCLQVFAMQQQLSHRLCTFSQFQLEIFSHEQIVT